MEIRAESMGYMSRTEAVTACLVDGMRNRDIAAMLQVSRARVSNVKGRAERKGLLPRRLPRPFVSRVELERSETVAILRREAKRRGVKVSKLIGKVVDNVAIKGLFEAVLD